MCQEELYGKTTPEQQKAISFGNLGWKAYENNELDKAIDYTKQALKIDNSLVFAKANLGLFHLIKSETISSLDNYLDAINYIRTMKNKVEA